MKTFFLLFLAALPAFAAPLPDNIRDVVQQLRKYDFTQSHEPVYALVQFTPRADAEQRPALAALLAQAVIAPDTTTLGRTILCQQLVLVAGEAEVKLLTPLLNDPKTAGDARIVLQPLGALPATPEKSVRLAQISDAKPATRVAGLASLTRFYPGDAVPVLVKALSDANPVVSATAIQLTGKLDGGALAVQLAKLDGARQELALGVLADRKVVAARGAVAELTGSGNELVRLAAISALGVLGDSSSVPVLAKLAAGEKGAVQTAAETALAQLAVPGVDEAVVNGIATGSPAARVAMINVAAARTLSAAVPALLAAARDADATVQTAALKALGKLGDAAVYSQLVEWLVSERNPALEEAVAAVGRRLDEPQARVTPLLAVLQRGGVSVAAQAAVLRTLALTGSGEALTAVRERLAASDAAVRDAAVRALCDWSNAAALEDLRKVAEDANATQVHRILAGRAVARLESATGIVKVDTTARRAALAKTLPAGAKLAAYLDCGAEAQDHSGSVRLRVTHGNNWVYHGEGDPAALTVAFASGHVDFEASGLDPQKSYALGFTWWDFDSNGRAQSVEVGGQKIVDKTVLPAGKQGPATLTRAIPAAAIHGGKAAIVFKQEAASNCVVSELWLVESASPLPATTSAAPVVPVAVSAPTITSPVVKANAGAAKKVLIVTGLEYPGHKWRETVPVLVEAISQDKRLEVSVVEEPQFMASPDLAKYDVIVLNYQNHNVLAPEGALANLKRTVESGKGLVLFHFACGAFIDWTTKIVAADFGMIAGRVWNPKLRGHDPRGPFKVNIADVQHPITKGLADFDTEDELYTCLAGDAPIQVLAKATSKVDKKDYPMAFVLTPGKGRMFHCVLGHDVKALNAAVQQLYRRGTAWAAGVEPQN